MTGHPPIQGAPEQRYLRRGANLRVRKVRRVRGLVRLLLVGAFNAAVAAAVLLSAGNTVRYLTRTGEFALRRIDLAGVERGSAEALRRGLEAHLGHNLLDLDLAAIEAEVERDPWVAHAAVRRALPDTLEVRVVERRPAALALIEGQVHLVDATGFVIGPTGAASADDLPVLTGLDERKGFALEQRLARGVQALERLARASGPFVRELSELDVSQSDRFVAHLSAGGPAILLDPQSAERNVPAFLELRPEIARRVEAPAYVDLRWRDRIAVMPSKPTEQGGSR